MSKELHELKEKPNEATAEDVLMLLKLIEDNQKVISAQYQNLTELRRNTPTRDTRMLEKAGVKTIPVLPEDVITLLNELRYHIRARQEDGSGYWQAKLTDVLRKYNCERPKALTPDVGLTP